MQEVYIDMEDLGDVLKEIEKSFNIKFAENELAHVATFGELCDGILNRVTQPDATGCTTQQAFYKIRKAISEVMDIEPSKIKPETKLEDIFPRKGRIRNIKRVRKLLDIRFNVLHPKIVVIIICVCMLVTNFFLWKLVDWKTTLYFLGLTVLAIILMNLTAKELGAKTIRDLVEKSTLGNYLKLRKDPATVNRAEIRKLIEKRLLEITFSDEPIKGIDNDTIIIERKKVVD